MTYCVLNGVIVSHTFTPIVAADVLIAHLHLAYSFFRNLELSVTDVNDYIEF